MDAGRRGRFAPLTSAACKGQKSTNDRLAAAPRRRRVLLPGACALDTRVRAGWSTKTVRGALRRGEGNEAGVRYLLETSQISVR